MTEEIVSENNDKKFTHVLMIELDYVIVNLREIEFDAIKRGIAPKGVELTSAMFSRSTMSPNHRAVIGSILQSAGKKSDAIEKAVNEVNKSIIEYCSENAVINSGVVELINIAKSRNVNVKLYSALDNQTAENLVNKIGLSDMGIEIINPSEIRESFPKADDWLKMLKKADIEDKTIVAVVSSQLACKGALTAGASCIVVPDKFTDFQDFSGAMFILDKLNDEDPNHILDLTLRI